MRRTASTLVTCLVLLSGCSGLSSPPAMEGSAPDSQVTAEQTATSSPAASHPTGSAEQTDNASAAPAFQPGTGAPTNSSSQTATRKVGDVDLDAGGTVLQVSLWAAPSQLIIRTDTGQTTELTHPFTSGFSSTMDVVQSPIGPHLLVTAGEWSNEQAWVLVPVMTGFNVAIELHANHDITVKGDQVRVRSRHYEIPNGFWLSAQYYRANPQTGQYELAGSDGQLTKADLTKGLSGAVKAVFELPDVLEYGTLVRAASRRLAAMTGETPSWYQVRLGEDDPVKLTITRYYLVRKADGVVLEWDITKGPWPQD